MKKIEKRSTPTEFRASTDERGKHLSAYAAKYNVLSTTLYDPQLGDFYEIILPGAFAEAVNDDVTCNIEHDDVGNFLGRTPNTLTLTDDEIGLRFDCLLPETAAGQKAFVHASEPRNDIRSCSFAFDVIEEEWDVTDDKPLRRLIKVKLYDCAIVIRPCYEFDTELSVRSRDLAAAKTITKDETPQDQADPHAWRRRYLELREKILRLAT